MKDLVNTDSQSGLNLFAGDFRKVLIGIIIIAGAGILAAGTVIGKITKGAIEAVAKAGNTGDGTLTVDAATPILGYAVPGAYIARCITAAVGGGTFRVYHPHGYALGDVAVGATFANQIKFAIAAGAADFVVGDEFSITIAAGSGKYNAYDDTKVDGTDKALAILAEDVDATLEDVVATAYVSGQFNEAALTGLDDAAKDDFAGTPVFFGTIV